MVLLKDISFGEKVLYIMALASKIGKIDKFSEPSVYSGFKRLIEKYPDHFPGIHFRHLADGSPHSNKLEDVLSRLGIWEEIWIAGPKFNYLQVNPKIIKSVEEDIKKEYCNDILSELKKFVEEFIELLPEN